MPTRDIAWPTGTPCWIDYGATDIAAARAFYSGVLGWTYTGGESEYGGYLTALANDRPAAGMAPSPDPSQPPRWTTYFATDDAEAAAAAITAAHGTMLMAPVDVGPLGRMALALDPQGNPFGLWQAGEHTGVRIYNEPGSLVWNEAAVDDPPAAREFYGAVFGFRFEEIEGADGYTTFATDANPLGGIGSRHDDRAGWGTCFSVASVDDSVAVVQKHGGTLLIGPMDTPYGRFAVVADPWGASFTVMQAPAG